MPIKFKRKVIENNRSLMVNIPFEIAEELQIKKGDVILITLDNHSFRCKKQE